MVFVSESAQITQYTCLYKLFCLDNKIICNKQLFTAPNTVNANLSVDISSFADSVIIPKTVLCAIWNKVTESLNNARVGANYNNARVGESLNNVTVTESSNNQRICDPKLSPLKCNNILPGKIDNII